MEHFDFVILGAGAAGLFCAGSARMPGRRILVVDHAKKAGEKIRISGGGRCNFTNLATSHDRFISQNPRFSASALARFTPRDFVDLVDRAGISWHEKAQGQLFCDGKATQIVDMLHRRAEGVEIRLQTDISSVHLAPDGFDLVLGGRPVHAARLVIATGGLSIPKMGATGFAYQIAKQLGIDLVSTRPGLVPMSLAPCVLERLASLSGVSLPSRGAVEGAEFADDLLFTHRGLSGPVILQLSSYWNSAEAVTLDLLPETDLRTFLNDRRRTKGRAQIKTVLADILPQRLADLILTETQIATTRLADLRRPEQDALVERLHRWKVKPVATEGYRTAEVTVGGIATTELDARTMRSRKYPNLQFIGEAVDVTGWLGGYNFQWAWASADAAGRAEP